MHGQISISLRLFLSRPSLHIPFSLLLTLLGVYHSFTLNAGKGEEKCLQSFGGDLKERDNLEDLSVDETVILKWALKEHNGMAWSGFIWLKTGKSSGLF